MKTKHYIAIIAASILLIGAKAQTNQTSDKVKNTDIETLSVLLANSVNSKTINWGANITESAVDGTAFAYYKLLLNSTVARYSLLIPHDDNFTFIDPIAYAQEVPGVIKFKYNTSQNKVIATICKFDKTTNTIGDSVAEISSASFIKNRLWHILENQIVFGDIQPEKKFYVTKGNDIVVINGINSGNTIQGGYDVEKNQNCTILSASETVNGTCYLLNKTIEPSVKSVYKILSETPEFSKFFGLIKGIPDTCITKLFTQQGIDYRIAFFNNYNYTVYVPTNEAIDYAINSGTIKTWETIASMADSNLKNTEISRLINILLYHFQDKAVFTNQTTSGVYQSNTIKTNTTTTKYGTAKNKFFKIGISGDGNTLTLTTDNQNPDIIAHTTGALTNIIAKEYVFAKLPSLYKNIDGTGSVSSSAFETSWISGSSSVVIHQIDKLLTFE